MERFLVGACALLVGCGGTSPAGGDAGDAGDGGSDVVYRAEPSCALTMESAQSPLLVSAHGPCDFGFALSVAAGAGDVAYVGFTTNIGAFHPRLWTIDPKSQPALENDPIGPEIFRVLADPSGTPSLIGAGDHGRVGPLVYFPSKPGAWTGETVTQDFAHYFATAFAPDGTLHAMWAGDTPLFLGHRTAPSAWTSMQITSIYEGDFAIAVGTDNKPRYVYFERRADMSARDVFYVADAAPIAFSKQPFGTYGNERTELALATGNIPIVIMDAADGTHLFVPTAMPIVDLAIPEMGSPTPKMCPDQTSGMSCSGTCSQSADGSSSHALVAAEDGTVWLASVHRHVDRDYTLQQRCGGICQCQAILSADRSTAELAIAKVSTTGTVDVRWRYALANTDAIQVALAARNGRLHVALALPSTNNLDAEIRYLAVDTTKL